MYCGSTLFLCLCEKYILPARFTYTQFNTLHFMNKTLSKLRAYERPEVQTFQFAPQLLLAASGNPARTTPPLQWGTQKKNCPWEKTETQNESL